MVAENQRLQMCTYPMILSNHLDVTVEFHGFVVLQHTCQTSSQLGNEGLLPINYYSLNYRNVYLLSS